MFALAAVLEISRFALLFFFVYSALDRASSSFAAIAVWFACPQLAIAGAMLYAAIKPRGLQSTGLNITRIGKALAAVAGIAAFFGRMIEAVGEGSAAGPVDWLGREPLVVATLGIDFTILLFLLSYQPESEGPSSDRLPDYEVTEIEEE